MTPWWPRTHGRPHLHEVTLIIDDVEHPLGRAGFRRLAIDRGPDGEDFGLMVNGERIFCRGAVWITTDIVRLPGGRADYEPWLRLAAEASMSLIRIGGTMAYETPEFFRLCDEFGLLVWQDFMFANFDYPKDDKALNAHVVAEVAQFLSATRLSPSLAVVRGGSATSRRRCSACRSDSGRAPSSRRSYRRLPDRFGRMSPMSSIRPSAAPCRFLRIKG